MCQSLGPFPFLRLGSVLLHKRLANRRIASLTSGGDGSKNKQTQRHEVDMGRVRYRSHHSMAEKGYRTDMDQNE